MSTCMYKTRVTLENQVQGMSRIALVVSVSEFWGRWDGINNLIFLEPWISNFDLNCQAKLVGEANGWIYPQWRHKQCTWICEACFLGYYNEVFWWSEFWHSYFENNILYTSKLGGCSSNGLLPQPLFLPSSCFLYCLGTYQGHLLHLSDLFLCSGWSVIW